MPLKDTVTFNRRVYDASFAEVHVYDVTPYVNSLLDAISLSGNEFVLDKEKVFSALRLIYPEGFKEKILILKAKRRSSFYQAHKE